MFVFKILLTISSIVSFTFSVARPGERNAIDIYDEIHGPEQVHIAYGNSPDEMIVVWSTGNITAKSFVTFGLNSAKLDRMAPASDAILTEGNPNGLNQIHRAIMTVGVHRCIAIDIGFLCERPYLRMSLCRYEIKRLKVKRAK